jgi:succinyl-diaminopimelate desuccinylase
MPAPETSAVGLTRELTRLRSINPPGEERPSADHLARLLEAAGLDVAAHSFAEGRTSLVARLSGGGEAPPLCFTGHLDTVPLGEAAWSREPLGGEIDGDRLYGRGSSDMKSGVAAMTRMAVELARLPRPRAGLVLVFTAGEETGCDGARYLAGLDGALPRAGALVVGEPTANRPLIGHKGALWLKAVFHGVTAQGSRPEQGDNALLKAARGALRLAEHGFNLERHHHLGGPTINIGKMQGGLNINSVPDRAEVLIDVRTIPGQSNDALSEEIGAVLGEGAEVARIVDVPAVASDPAHDWIAEAYEICSRVTGTRTPPEGATYFTDAAVLAPAMGDVPALVLGPGEPAMAHKTDEYCVVPRIEEAVHLYTEIARRWMGC